MEKGAAKETKETGEEEEGYGCVVNKGGRR